MIQIIIAYASGFLSGVAVCIIVGFSTYKETKRNGKHSNRY